MHFISSSFVENTSYFIIGIFDTEIKHIQEIVPHETIIMLNSNMRYIIVSYETKLKINN